MNVLLIAPAYPDGFYSFESIVGVIGKKALLPPLGPLTVAALLPEDWGKRFFDLQARQPSDGDIEWADCAFVSILVRNIQDESALAIIARCKAAGLRVVAGGPGLSPDREAFARQRELYREVDHFILREAEVTLPMFLEDLEKGEPEPLYTTDRWADITESPRPMYELLEFGDYAAMGVQWTRGCPHSCDFCLIPLVMGRPGRAKSTDQFLAELDHLYSLGWRGEVNTNDDNFMVNIRNTKKDLLPALVRWQEEHDKPFMFHASVDVRVGEDAELLKLFFDAGFRTLYLGIENLNEDCLTEVNKRISNSRDMAAIVERIHRAGIIVQCGLMVGFDHDKPSVFNEMGEFVDRTGIILPYLTKIDAIPGTPLYQRLLEAGRIDHTTVGMTYESNILGVPMGDDVLDEGYVRLMDHFWEPKHFYRRIKTVMSMLRPPTYSARLSFANLVMSLRIVFIVGLAKESWQFWKLLFWTLLRRPRMLSVFFASQPLGYGFRKRCEQVFDEAYRARWKE